jgi:hypothetical protein
MAENPLGRNTPESDQRSGSASHPVVGFCQPLSPVSRFSFMLTPRPGLPTRRHPGRAPISKPAAATRLRGPLGRPTPGRERVLSVHPHLTQRPQGRAGSPSRPHPTPARLPVGIESSRSIPTSPSVPKVGLDLRAGHTQPRRASGRAGSPSRPHLPRCFRRKRPTFLPPSAPTGARIQPPSPAGGRHNRRPAQPLPRREASWLENMMLWHILCK